LLKVWVVTGFSFDLIALGSGWTTGPTAVHAHIIFDAQVNDDQHLAGPGRRDEHRDRFRGLVTNTFELKDGPDSSRGQLWAWRAGGHEDRGWRESDKVIKPHPPTPDDKTVPNVLSPSVGLGHGTCAQDKERISQQRNWELLVVQREKVFGTGEELSFRDGGRGQAPASRRACDGGRGGAHQREQGDRAEVAERDGPTTEAQSRGSSFGRDESADERPALVLGDEGLAAWHRGQSVEADISSTWRRRRWTGRVPPTT
jgi:hypothetical protein